MELDLILDIGSTHLGDPKLLKQHIDCASRLPVKLKAQLFPREAAGPNTYLPLEMYREAWEYAESKEVTMFSSVFSIPLAIELSAIDNSQVKLSYSMRGMLPTMLDPSLPLFDFVYMSIPYTEAPRVHDPQVAYLLCIPEYPVLHDIPVRSIDWEMFDGFSDHTLGIKQTVDLIHAVQDTGRIRRFTIEKHVRLLDSRACPDSTFAITWDQVEELIRRTECGY